MFNGAADKFGWIGCVIGLALVGGVATAAPVQAPDVQYAVTTGVLYSDNIFQAATDDEQGTVATAGLDLRARRDSGRLRYNADSNLNFLHYLDTGGLSDEVVGGFTGSASYAFVPDHFQWVASQNFSQTRTNNLAPATPDNRQNRNWVSTGPELQLRVAQNFNVELALWYAREDYESSPFDTNRWGGTARLIRQSSDRTSIGVGATSERIEFRDSDPSRDDYDLNEALFLYQVTTNRTGLQVEAGYGEIDRGDQSQGDPILRVELRRRVSSFSSLRLNLTQQISTTATSSLGSGIGGSTVVSNNALAQSDPYRLRQIKITWLTEYVRTRFDCGAETGKEEHESGTNPDRTLSAAHCQVTRHLTPRADLSVFGGLSSDDVDGATYGGDNTGFGVGFSWKFGRAFAALLQAAHVNEANYSENTVWLRLIYSPQGTVQTTLGDLAPGW